MSKAHKMRVAKNTDSPLDQKPKVVVARLSRPQDHGLKTIPDQVAASSVYYRNWEYKGAREDFPNHLTPRFIDRMYPYAVPSPLLVDFAQSPGELSQCEAKAPRVRARGYRYLILKPGMDINAALEQLEQGQVI